MKTSNQSNGAVRQSEVGHVWREVVTNDQKTLELEKLTTFRVRAGGATTVNIGGVLAMTMQADEIAIFNAGPGDKSDNKGKVTVVIGGANAWVQTADDSSKGRESKDQ